MGGELYGGQDPVALGGAFRQVLLDDLAEIKLALGDYLPVGEDNVWEALARVVGALHLTAEEEDWLERQ